MSQRKDRAHTTAHTTARLFVRISIDTTREARLTSSNETLHGIAEDRRQINSEEPFPFPPEFPFIQAEAV